MTPGVYSAQCNTES